MCKEKGTRRFKFDDVSYFYKTICVSQLGKRFEIFDTSTDIYRPLTDEEVDNLIELGLDKFTNKLSISFIQCQKLFFYLFFLLNLPRFHQGLSHVSKNALPVYLFLASTERQHNDH